MGDGSNCGAAFLSAEASDRDDAPCAPPAYPRPSCSTSRIRSLAKTESGSWIVERTPASSQNLSNSR
jgi:hypothetical protein